MTSQDISVSHAGSKVVDPRPVILFVDDDTVFLHFSEECWKEYYLDRAVLYTLDPRTTDPVAWVHNRLELQERLDAVYLDERIPGKSGLHILEDLQRLEKARYLPMVVMTAYREQAHDREALDKGALRYIHKHPGVDRNMPASFLDEALFALPQLRDQVEDTMWTDLLSKVATQLVEKGLADVVDMAAEFLAEHFGNSIVYVREHDAEDNLRRLGKNDPFQEGLNISPNTVPYLARLLDSQGDPVVRRDMLVAEDLGDGHWRRLKGWRLIGVPLTLREKRIGTITLYRQPERPPFRRKDEIFLQHFALAIASALGAERALQQLRQRQTQLAQFVYDVSTAKNEQEACDLLASFLQKEVNGANDRAANVTVRLLQSGQPTMPFTSIKGISPVSPDPIKSIYDGDDAVVPRVIRSRKPERCGNIRDNVSQSTGKRFKFTIPVQSALTVPFLSADLCLGAVHMAHANADYYTKEDEVFAESVTRVTAHTLVSLKAQRFLKGLLALVNDLVRADSAPTEALLARAFALLHDFTGYARLLYMVPPEGETGEAWKVERVIGDGGQPLTEGEIKRWRERIIETWGGTFLRRALLPGRPMYTDTQTDIGSDVSLGIRAEAMEVVHLYPQHGGVPTGMLALLFLLPKAINDFQREQLNACSHFIGALMEAKGSFKRLLDEKNLAEQEAMLGRTLSQFRHSLRNQLGRLDTVLENAQDESGGSTPLQEARAIVGEIYQESENARTLVKMPENCDFDVRAVWNKVVAKLNALAQSRKIVLREWAHPAPLLWNSDPDIVEVILENLVQNSVEHGRPGDSVELQVESLAAHLRLTVRDSGPGIRESVRPRLFEPGVTTKSNGTGFGLYYSRRRARDLQGNLVFEKRYQGGAAFSLILPRQA